MDKIKQFLKDNKGCPLTAASTKQLFTKFLEFLVKEGYGEVADKLSVVDDKLVVDGDLVAKNVIEDGDTELIDLTPYINTGFAKSNSLYAKLLVKHGTLHIIVSGNIVCSGNVATNINLLNNFIDAIPESIRSRIYRGEGTKITETPLGQVSLHNAVVGSIGFRFYSGATSNVQPYLLASYQGNELTLQLRPIVALSEDTDLFLDCRITLTI